MSETDRNRSFYRWRNAQLLLCLLLGNLTLFGCGGGSSTITPITPVITTVAGTGTGGYNGDNIPSTSAELYLPSAVALDSSGNLYIADKINYRIRKVDASTDIITTVAGNGNYGYSGDGGPATDAEISGVFNIVLDTTGNLFIADSDNSVVRRVDHGTGIITTVAGNGTAGYSGDGGPAVSAELHDSVDVRLDASGNLYIADRFNLRIRAVNMQGTTQTLLGVSIGAGDIQTVAGTGGFNYTGDGGPATSAQIGEPVDVALDSAGNLYITDYLHNVIRRVDHSTGVISTVAGTGTGGYNGDNIPATSAELFQPYGVVVDSSGNLWIADSGNLRIRKVDTSGIITTVAGNGIGGYSGDNGPATSAELNGPSGVAVDRAGNLYIADTGNDVARKVTF